MSDSEGAARGNGAGCLCGAHCFDDCGCPDADWTPREVYELQDKVAALKNVLAVAIPWLERCPSDGLNAQKEDLLRQVGQALSEGGAS